MAIGKKYLHAYTHLPAIPRDRLIGGVLLGVLFSFSFYSFLYVCREALRILFFLTEESDVLVLSDSSVSLFNLVLAYIAVIMGQSVCFTHCFDIPLRQLRKYIFQMRLVVNDQRGMNSYFISWFSRLAFVFVIVIGGTSGGGIYVIETFSPYEYLFVLIIFVLFLHTWMTLRRLFNGKSFKWMLISAVTLSLFSFGLSRINLFDYHAVNEVILKKNIFYSYNLRLPVAQKPERMSSEGRRRATLWIAAEKDKSEGAEPVLFVKHWGNRLYNRQQIPIDSLKEYFVQWDQNIREPELYEPCVLYAHQDIRMKYINRIKKELAEVSANRIEHAVLPSARKYDDRYYTYLVIPDITGYAFGKENAVQELEKELNETTTVYDLQTQDSGQIFFDGIPVTCDLKDFLRDKIKSTLDYCIRYYIGDESTYAEYIYIRNSMKQAILEIRDEYALEAYEQFYEMLEEEDARKVRLKFPYKLAEIWNPGF